MAHQAIKHWREESKKPNKPCPFILLISWISLCFDFIYFEFWTVNKRGDQKGPSHNLLQLTTARSGWPLYLWRPNKSQRSRCHVSVSPIYIERNVIEVPSCQEDVHMNKHGYVSVDELIALREKEHGKTTSLRWHFLQVPDWFAW